MLKVNLLPPKKRKVNIAAYIQDFFPYIAFLFILVVIFNVLLVSFGAKKMLEVQKYEREWKNREPAFNEFQELKKEVVNLRQKSSAFKQNVFPSMSFSEIMYVLYEKLPINLWFSELDFRDNALSLKGGAIDMEVDASLSVKEYVSSLSESKIKDFFDGEVSIVALERSRIKDKSIVRFELKLVKLEKKDDKQ